MIEHDPLISEYSHEKARPREAEALRTLQKVASMVKPIMRQRGWKVGVLAEFYPPERSLLGLNWDRGQKICLRLRYPTDERQFLPLEDVVDTMLHELCHIVHGPHDEAFHTLWNQLRDEHEALLRKGYTGEGFLSTGHKLGGRRVPLHEARRQARAAAEKRRAARPSGSGDSAGGQKLGGRAAGRGEDIRRVIADAAQRRLTISRGCAAVDEDARRKAQLVAEAARNGFTTRAAADDADEQAVMQAYIELVQEEEREKWGEAYVPPSSANPAGSQGAATSPVKEDAGPSRAPPVPARSKPAAKVGGVDDRERAPPVPTRSKPSAKAEFVDERGQAPAARPKEEPPVVTDPGPIDEFWSCPTCTLNNLMDYLACDACQAERPPLYDTAATPPISRTSPPSAPRQQPTASRPKPPSSHSLSRSTAHRPQTAGPPRSAAAARAAEAAAARSRKENGLKNLASLYTAEQRKPLGWLCMNCNNFMESEWWTCANCGQMKQSS